MAWTIIPAELTFSLTCHSFMSSKTFSVFSSLTTLKHVSTKGTLIHFQNQPKIFTILQILTDMKHFTLCGSYLGQKRTKGKLQTSLLLKRKRLKGRHCNQLNFEEQIVQPCNAFDRKKLCRMGSLLTFSKSLTSCTNLTAASDLKRCTQSF